MSKDGVITNSGIRQLTRMLVAKIALDGASESLGAAVDKMMVMSNPASTDALNKFVQESIRPLERAFEAVNQMRAALGDACETHAHSIVVPVFHVAPTSENLWRVVGPGAVTIAHFTDHKDATDYCEQLNTNARQERR